jgi:hypothetical protein
MSLNGMGIFGFKPLLYVRKMKISRRTLANARHGELVTLFHAKWHYRYIPTPTSRPVSIRANGMGICANGMGISDLRYVRKMKISRRTGARARHGQVLTLFHAK